MAAYAHHLEDQFINQPDIMVSIRPSHLTIYESYQRTGRSKLQNEAAALLQNADQIAAYELSKDLRNEYTSPAQLVERIKTAVSYSGLIQSFAKITGKSLIEVLHADGRVDAEFVNNLIDAVEVDISEKAGRRIKKSVNWLVEMADSKTLRWICKETGRPKKGTFKVNFVTLTLSATQFISAQDWHQLTDHEKQFFTYSEIQSRTTWISDNDIKSKLLNQFLIECRKYVEQTSAGADKLVYYFWRAEAQKNGNIHFHILTDKYLPWDWMRDTWNRIQNKLGFIDRFSRAQKEKYKNGFVPDLRRADVWPVAKQLESYKKGSAANWTNPNSTDVHSVRGIGKLAAYLSKYVSKSNADARKINGRKWYLSTALSKLQSATCYIEDVLEDVRLLQKHHREKYLDNCSQIYAGIKDLIKLDCEQLLTAFRRYKSAAKAAAYGYPPPDLLF